MSMPRAVRHINEIRILDALFHKGPMSRADLGRELGLMRSTAGNLVAGLARDGLVTDLRDEPSGRSPRTGRPGSSVGLNAAHSYFVGAEIAVGRITAVVLDLGGSVLARRQASFAPEGNEAAAVADALAGAVTRIAADVARPDAIRGLNVAIAGLLDHDGRVLSAPLLGWVDVPLLDMLRARLPAMPLIVAENDANAFAAAELQRAGGGDTASALFVFLDAGVGGGIVQDGQLLRGHRGYAGEIGHIHVGERGFRPSMALPGSLESFVGRDAIVARHGAHGGRSATLDDLLAACAAGEAAAMTTAAEWSFYLGRGLATLTSVLDPEAVVLGGPVAALLAHAGRGVTDAMRSHLMPNRPLPALRASSVGADAPAVGAASLLHRGMLSFDKDLVFNGAGRDPAARPARRPPTA